MNDKSMQVIRKDMVERPKPRRHRGHWVFLVLLLAIGIFVALPIASGHSKPEGLEPQAMSRFLVGMWDYWVQIVGDSNSSMCQSISVPKPAPRDYLDPVKDLCS